MADYDELVAETLAKRPNVDAILTKKAQRGRIAAALRALRARKGLSQRQLSARTGWTQPFIARIESIAEDQMPTPETIVRYVEACGAKVGLVFFDQEGGEYRVGDAVALTDDTEAARYLAGLGEAREKRNDARHASTRSWQALLSLHESGTTSSERFKREMERMVSLWQRVADEAGTIGTIEEQFKREAERSQWQREAAVRAVVAAIASEIEKKKEA